MQVLNSVRLAQEELEALRAKESIALVPTMGCLHQGHLKLIRLAKKNAKRVVASIFVNPLQFGPHEDFDRYPRTLESDKEKLESVGVDYLFHPSVEDFYPKGFSNHVKVGELGSRLCGKFRPGHFDGVATVCLKLFQVCRADMAVFGEKDYQQLQVIRNLVRDFNLPLTIFACPIVREEDGLAMSSRNRYLSKEERKLAAQIPKALMQIKEIVTSQKEISVRELLNLVEKHLTQVEVQYSEITEGPELNSAPNTAVISRLNSPHFFLAVKIGKTRLIDNMSLKGLK